MTEDGALADGQNRRQPPSLVTDGCMTHCIDALVQAVQASRPHTSRDRAPSEAEATKLGGGHDPVLPAGDFCEPLVERGAFVRHSGTKAPRPAASPPTPANFGSGPRNVRSESR